MPRSFQKGGGGGGVTSGNTVSGGGANRVLYEDASQNLATSANFTYGASASQLQLIAGAATDVPFNIKAAASQSGNLLEVNSSSGSGGDLAKITSDGALLNLGGAQNIADPSLSSRGNFVLKTAGYLATNFSGSNNGAFMNGNSIEFGPSMVIDWNPSQPGAGGTGDLGIARYSAGVLRVSDGNTSAIRGLLGGGAAVASAAALPLPTGRVFHVTGTTNITSITSTNFQSGAVITLIFDDILTFTDGSNLKLAGNFVTTADDTITLVYDGTNWYEMCRSVN